MGSPSCWEDRSKVQGFPAGREDEEKAAQGSSRPFSGCDHAVSVLLFFFSQPNRDGLPELVAGGLSYCLGMVFFKSDGRIPFAHAIWHLFVAIGAGIHYYAIWRYLYRPSTLEAKRPR